VRFKVSIDGLLACISNRCGLNASVFVAAARQNVQTVANKAGWQINPATASS